MDFADSNCFSRKAAKTQRNNFDAINTIYTICFTTEKKEDTEDD
jgi:hypothetical protein